jgi:hypothetical protein
MKIHVVPPEPGKGVWVKYKLTDGSYRTYFGTIKRVLRLVPEGYLVHIVFGARSIVDRIVLDVTTYDGDWGYFTQTDANTS